MIRKKSKALIKKLKPHTKVVKYILYSGGIVVFLLAASSLVTITIIYKNLPKPEDLFSHRINQSTKLYDREGKVLLYEIHGEEKRTVIPYNEIPNFVKQATIAIEDQGFYNHPAFDWKAIVRSLIKNIIYLRIEQGGSTITQQLAKSAYLTPEKTLKRKITELFLAIRLERQYTKDEILNLYLNQIPYGSNAYGIEAAANTFFNKKASELDIAEAALLAAVANRPSYYSPYGYHKEELKTRQNLVLKEMKSLGYINDKQLKQAMDYKLAFAPQATSIKAPHFVTAVQNYLEKKYGFDEVENGGLSVVTTLNWKLQQAAEDIVFRGVERNTTLYQGKNAALLAEDPKTGEILAMVGSKNYFDIENEGNFNVATQGLRQPGSSFKPFAYYTAFKKGYIPETVLFDIPTEFDTTKIPENSYKPGDYSAPKGPVSLRTALAQSINIPAVKIMYLVGIDNVMKVAKDFGINTLNERGRYGLSLVLGGGEVKLSELVHAYSVFANDGMQSSQTMVLEVKNDKGEVIETYQNEARQIGEPQYVRMINDVLSDTDSRAGLFGSTLNLTVFPGHQVAIKTGTTNNFVDAWALGYTPGIVVGVWAGNNHREPLQKNGGSVVAVVPMWSEFMNKALESVEPEAFLKPDPYTANKPILKGDYQSQKQIHSILYYINKNDPLGPPPSNPEEDPQFWNWEIPVLDWAKQNIPDFNNYNKEIVNSSGDLGVQINVTSPGNGVFIDNQINLAFNITTNSQVLESVDVLWNDAVIEQFRVDPNSLPYKKTISPPSVDTQNKLTIKTTNNKGVSFKKDIILFKQNPL